MTNVKVITSIDRKLAIESAIHYLREQQPFYGALLQELTIKYDARIPTAGITFNKAKEQFEVYLSTEWFPSLSQEARVAVLHHEILHFTNDHLIRLPMLEAKEEDRRLQNIAGDMAINQYLTYLPDGCVDVKDWKYRENGNTTDIPFPKFQSIETYYELIKNNQEANKDKLQSYKSFDEHDWEQLDEETKQKFLEEAKKVVKRTIEKTASTYTVVPKGIQDYLEELERQTAALNYKGILKNAIKRTVSAQDRQGTWKRPNKRYGTVAPGTKLGELPKLFIYADSSGSISHTELNNYFGIMDNFLRVGARTCQLALWHTET
jgi:predicted metal-dependent peptidase